MFVESRFHADIASVLASLARVEQKIDDRLLEQARIPDHAGEVAIDLLPESDARLREPVLDQADGIVDQGVRIDPLRGRRVAARQPEQPADDLVDAIRLRENRPGARGDALAIRRLGQQLLGPRRDHAERRRDLVRDPHRQRADDRGAGGALQPLVAAVPRLGDGEPSLEGQLLSLNAQGDATKCQHEPGRREDAQDQAAARPQLAIAFALRGRQREDVPRLAAARVHVREAGERRPRREPERGRLFTRDVDHRLAVAEGLHEARRRDFAPVGRTQRRRSRRTNEDRKRLGSFDRSDLGEHGLRTGGALADRPDAKAGAESRRQRGLLLREIVERRRGLPLRIPVCERGDQHDGGDHGRRQRRSASHRACHVEVELPVEEGRIFQARCAGEHDRRPQARQGLDHGLAPLFVSTAAGFRARFGSLSRMS